MVQVFHEARLMNRHDRAQSHGNRGELPEIRHQPRMRIGGYAVAVHLLTEIAQIFLVQAPLQVGAGVDAGRRMPLNEQHIAGLLRRRGAPEVVETDIVQGGRRGKTGDVPAQFAGHPIRPHHHGHGIPANQRANAPLQRVVAVAALFQMRRNGVQIGGLGLIGNVYAGAPRVVDQPLDEEMGALAAFQIDHRIQRIHPLAGFDCVDVRWGVGLGLGLLSGHPDGLGVNAAIRRRLAENCTPMTAPSPDSAEFAIIRGLGDGG